MKRILLPSLAIAAVLLAGTSTSTLATPACGCGTWSGVVLGALNYVSRFLYSYAEHHAGLFPPTQEVERLLAASRFYDELFTTDAEIQLDPLLFLGFHREGPQITYAVSPDRTQVLLLGMGVSEERLRLYFFGHKVDEWLTGRHSFPILRPGEALPPDSAPG